LTTITAPRPRRRSLRPGLAPAGAALRPRLGQSLRGDGREQAMASKKTPGAEVAELLVAAGAALGRRAWREARDLCEQALSGGERADALELLAVASWWQDDVDAAIAARERAYVLRRERGETVEAARVAGFLAWDYGAMRGVNAVANGWLQRARRLAGELAPTAEHAWLPLIEASFHLDTDPDEVLRLSTEAAERAHALGGLDVEMTARTLQGLALVSLGRVQEGTRLLDEGTAAATAGELYDPIAIGSCCCNMIIACERSRDFDRAGQWCEQLTAFCDRTGQRPLLALCRAHHGTVRMMRGEWVQAEQDLAWAAGELSTLRPPLAGYARARFAQLRRRQGRPREARALVDEAGTHVLAPLVRADLSLDDGDPSAALGHAERYLRGLGGAQPIESAAALELMVAARIRLAELPAARAAHEQLAAIAVAVGTLPLRAAERCAAGRIARAERDPRAARSSFEDALDLYQRSVMPFDAAQVRLELARAFGEHDQPAAGLEQALAARSAFEQLGAALAAQEADKVAARLGGRRASARSIGMTAREIEVLSLVARGLSNREIAERLVVSEHTVHRHLANIYARLGVSSRAAAVAVASGRDLLD
jgi:ATP/maltotriose-dependent transcriptional regulator MalT